MKKFIAIVMVVAMVAAFVPTTFAVEAENVEQEVATTENTTFDKSNYDLPEAYRPYGTDYYGNKIQSGTMGRTTQGTDMSNVAAANEKAQTKWGEDEGGFADSPHYGVGLFDPSDSLATGYSFENSDFKRADDFFTSGAVSYSMMFSPSGVSPEQSGYATSVGLKSFAKGDRFWFNFDIIYDYSNTSGPVYFVDTDGERAQIPYTIYMYAGSASDWDEEIGVSSLRLEAYWQGLTRVSTQITVPTSNEVYVFAVVLEESVVQDYSIRGFEGWLTISEFEKTYKEAKVDSKIEPYKDYTADLGSGEMLLLYGDDVGNVLANGVLYEVELKGGERYALRAEGDGKIGGRVFFLDENKDILSNNYLGTGAVTGGDAYEALTWAVLPPVDGTYYILIAGFWYDDDGLMDFELEDYDEAQENNDYLPYLPEVEEGYTIDLDTLGEEEIIEEIGGMEAWGYFWDASLGMGILAIVCPGTYTLVGEKEDMMLDIYDGVTVNLDNAKVATILCNGVWAPCTINATGKSSVTDNFYGVALINYNGCYSGIYLTGDELTIAGEKSNGALLEVPTHVLTKKLVASAKPTSGSFTVAFWVAGWNTPELTFANDVEFKSASGSRLQKTTMFYEDGEDYTFGYTVSQYSKLYRYYGSPDFYQIADYFEATSKSGSAPVDPDDPEDPTDMLGDANCDGKLNTGDATAILRHAAGISVLADQGLVNADINKDDKVNTGDATMVLRVVAGIVPAPEN